MYAFVLIWREQYSYIENNANKHLESYKERHFTWLDAFYNLIVAIIIFEVSRQTIKDVSVFGFLSFGFRSSGMVMAWCDFLFDKICYR